MARERGKGRMRMGAAVAQVMKFEACFLGIIYIAKRESWTHGKILEERSKQIHQHPNWPRLPDWGRMSVNRYSSGALNTLDRMCVHWQHYLDGKRIASADVPDDRWIDIRSRFEWTHSGELFLKGVTSFDEEDVYR